jgi:hypothetical protein
VKASLLEAFVLAQFLVLIFAPLFALITLGEPAPSGIPAWAEPLVTGGRLWIKQMDGPVVVQGWDRSEVALVACLHDGSGGGRAELEVRQVPEGLEIEVRIPRQDFLFGFQRSLGCDLAIRVPRRWIAAGGLSKDG